ncbi:lysozyme [Acinetobacter junii]|uniref:lysozyme n=1 Tax=Acinetobacter junii TaxID=40215 RepID=UPI0030A632FD
MSKSISKTGIDLISSFEGIRLNAYDDGVGVWTIGIGTTIYPNGVKVKKGDKCTLEQAKEYFAHDLKSFEKTVNDSVKVPLSQNQFDALVSLTYNIGSAAFKNSTLLKKLNAKDHQGAADQFLRWNKGGGKVMKGLVRRREAERALFLKK